ncbi:MAG TPA: Rieske 2Fe-2S domain-containing protein [Candidatus Limnocylindrales bacterium]
MASSDTVVPVLLPIPPGLEVSATDDRPFEPLLALAELPPGALRRITRGDLDLLLAHTSRGICLIDDRCPHMSAPLSVGELDDCVIACPLHSGRFDLASGEVVQFPTTGGLDADGGYHPPGQPAGGPPRPEPTDLKARARAATRVRRIRYYALRINGAQIEGRLPGSPALTRQP